MAKRKPKSRTRLMYELRDARKQIVYERTHNHADECADLRNTIRNLRKQEAVTARLVNDLQRYFGEVQWAEAVGAVTRKEFTRQQTIGDMN